MTWNLYRFLMAKMLKYPSKPITRRNANAGIEEEKSMGWLDEDMNVNKASELAEEEAEKQGGG